MLRSILFFALLVCGLNAAPLEQETLDKATEYLREITCDPKGHFVSSNGDYFWENGEAASVKMHANAIVNFAEKKEVGKTIKYISYTPKEGLTPKIKVAACYLYVGDEVLFVERPPESKTEPARFGIPGGKIDKGETSTEAVYREIFEETGINLRQDFPSLQVRELTPVYVTLSSGFSFLYCPFEVHLPCKPEVSLSREHVSYRWVTLAEARKRLPLITGEEECLDIKMEEDRQPLCH